MMVFYYLWMLKTICEVSGWSPGMLNARFDFHFKTSHHHYRPSFRFQQVIRSCPFNQDLGDLNRQPKKDCSKGLKNPRPYHHLPIFGQPKRSSSNQEVEYFKNMRSTLAASIPPTRSYEMWKLVTTALFWIGCAICLIGTPSSAFAVSASVSSTYEKWDLFNGQVQLPKDKPLQFQYLNRKTRQLQTLSLIHPQLVGAGAGGAVFVFDGKDSKNDETPSIHGGSQIKNSPQAAAEGVSIPKINSNTNHKFLLKISWEGTSQSVQQECRTFQILEDRGVQASERCLGIFQYPNHSSSSMMTTTTTAETTASISDRSMILVTPYMPDAVASIGEVSEEAVVRKERQLPSSLLMSSTDVINQDENGDDKSSATTSPTTTTNIINHPKNHNDKMTTKSPREVAVNSIARHLVQMLLANVVVIDVQPLISPSTGQTLFIDMTEAQQIRINDEGDNILISSFISEMIALIPEPYWNLAKSSILDELNLQMQQKEQRDRGHSNDDTLLHIRSILEEQTPFFD